MPPRTDPAGLDDAFSALGDPTRRAILERLAQGEAGFTELARPFDMSRPAVVKHLRALERAGLVDKDEGGTRPVYRLAPEALAGPRDWLDGFARFWEGALDRLEDYIAEMDAAPEEGGKSGEGGGPPSGAARGRSKGERS